MEVEPDESRAAAFFDLDKTIIAKSSTLAFGGPFYRGGLINRRAVVRSAYAQAKFALSGIDERQMEKMRAYLTQLCAGWNVEQIRSIVTETLHLIVDPLIYAEAVELIRRHQADGLDVVVVSSSGSEVVDPIAAMIGANASIATRMVEREGRYTGEIEFYAYGQNKATAIRALALSKGYDLARCFAYSDSVTDLPMLEIVGNPVVVNPDRALQRQALARNWPVLTFSNGVQLRRRISLLQVKPVARLARAVVVTSMLAVISAVIRRCHHAGNPMVSAVIHSWPRAVDLRTALAKRPRWV